MNRKMPVGALLAALLVTSSILADDVDDKVTQDALRDMQREIQELKRAQAADRARLAEQDQELQKMRVDSQEQWMTEQRASEIRDLVHDVLADADVRSSLLSNGLQAGWNDQLGFFLSDDNGRFMLRILGLMQFRWMYSYHDTIDDGRGGFENTRTKLTFRGYVYQQDIEYLIRGNFDRAGGGSPVPASADVGGEFRLQDAWIRWVLNDQWSFKVGQFKVPFNREELVAPQYQLLVERSLVNESLSLGRTQGVEVTFETKGGNHHFRLVVASDGAYDTLAGASSVVGTTPTNTTALIEDVEYMFAGRYELKLDGRWDQFVDFTGKPQDSYGRMIGLAFLAQINESGTPADEAEWYGWTADLSLEWAGANFFASFIHQYAESPSFGFLNFYGFVAQGGMYVTPKVEVFGRFEWGQIDAVASLSDLYAITAGFNYYIEGHDLKWTTDVGVALDRVEDGWDSDIAGWRFDTSANVNQIVLRSQLQLNF